MKITTLGTCKDVFQVHGVDERGRSPPLVQLCRRIAVLVEPDAVVLRD